MKHGTLSGTIKKSAEACEDVEALVELFLRSEFWVDPQSMTGPHSRPSETLPRLYIFTREIKECPQL